MLTCEAFVNGSRSYNDFQGVGSNRAEGPRIVLILHSVFPADQPVTSAKGRFSIYLSKTVKHTMKEPELVSTDKCAEM